MKLNTILSIFCILFIVPVVSALNVTEIQNQLNTNMTVTLPCGTFYMNGSLAFKLNNQVLNSTNCTTLVFIGGKGQSISAKNLKGITLSGIIFDSNNNTGGILMQNVNNAKIENIKSINIADFGTRHCLDFTGNSTYNTIMYNEMAYCYDDGIAFDGPGVAYNKADYNYIHDNMYFGGSSGIENNDGSHHNTAYGNRINHTKSYSMSIKVHIGEMGSYSNVYCNNTLEDGVWGIGVSNVNGYIDEWNYDNLLCNNTILNPRDRGICVNYANNTIVDNNFIWNAPKGIYISGNTNGTLISRNNISANNKTEYGIRDQPNNDRLYIVGNYVDPIVNIRFKIDPVNPSYNILYTYMINDFGIMEQNKAKIRR